MLFLKINPIQYYIDIINKGFILNDKNYYPFIMFLFNN
jgi:hypothetical protein